MVLGHKTLAGMSTLGCVCMSASLSSHALIADLCIALVVLPELLNNPHSCIKETEIPNVDDSYVGLS